MTPEIRRAALRMAAKAALLTTLGCSGGAPAPATPLAHQGDAPASAPAPAPSCATYLAGLPTAKMPPFAHSGDGSSGYCQDA
jgi:hypothetical protein